MLSPLFKAFICSQIFRLMKISEAQRRRNITDFEQLELNQDSLRGSRWSAEYQGIIEVYNAIELVDIARVDVDTMSVRVEFHLRQRWKVDDLKFPSRLFKPEEPSSTFVIASATVLDSVWSPDSYFPNSRETKIASFSDLQSTVKIFKNKTITYAARVSVLLGCAFNFQYYPMDSQSCQLIMESYAYPTTLVAYTWEPPSQMPPLTLGNFQLLQYALHTPLNFFNDSAVRYGRSTKFARVIVDFTFERKIGQYIIQTTIPTVLVVVLSWFSFWLGLDAIPGRISLVITCMLSLVTMHSSQKKDLPPVNYVKMSDIWMVGCMTFVFAAFCEFIIVKYIHWSHQKKEEAKNAVKPFVISSNSPTYYPISPQRQPHKRNTKNDHNIMICEKNNNTDQRKVWDSSTTFSDSAKYFERNQYYNNKSNFKDKRSNKDSQPSWTIIDNISKFAFPLLFAIFCGVYWPVLFVYATASLDQELKS